MRVGEVQEMNEKKDGVGVDFFMTLFGVGYKYYGYLQKKNYSNNISK